MNPPGTEKGNGKMKYTPQLLPRRDKIGNTHSVGIIYDEQAKTYVGEIRAGRSYRTVSGSYRQFVTATGEANTPDGAADDAIKNFNN
jgi:hypothetical protein